MTHRGNLRLPAFRYDSPTPQIGHEIVDHVFVLVRERGAALFLDQKIELSLFLHEYFLFLNVFYRKNQTWLQLFWVFGRVNREYFN